MSKEAFDNAVATGEINGIEIERIDLGLSAVIIAKSAKWESPPTTVTEDVGIQNSPPTTVVKPEPATKGIDTRGKDPKKFAPPATVPRGRRSANRHRDTERESSGQQRSRTRHRDVSRSSINGDRRHRVKKTCGSRLTT